MAYRIIQWTTGNIGKHAMRQVIEQPGLELVGVRVTSAEKDGKDAGAIIGLPDIGLKATRDVKTLLATKADCVLYMPADAGLSDATVKGSHGEALVNEIISILESGKHVVSTALIPLLWPSKHWQPVADKIDAVCKRVGKSFYCCGVQPGYVNDQLALFISGASQRTDRIRMQTFSDWSNINKFEMLRSRGFGLTPEDFEKRHPGGVLGDEHTSDWVRESAVAIRIVADRLQVPLESVTGRVKRWTLPKDVAPSPSITSGVVASGTVCAQHVTVTGNVRGKDPITFERIIMLGPHPGADFPDMPPHKGQVYRVVFEGRPPMYVDVVFQDVDKGGAISGAQMSTASIAVNSIPAVCAATPGFQTLATLPALMGVGTLRP